MIIDPSSLGLAQEIEAILADPEVGVGPGEVKPELMQSVLEIATDPCDTLARAAGELADLRGRVSDAATRRGLAIGAAGTHPTARCADQQITDRARYRDLVDELAWIARHEMIFGTHVHVGVQGADAAIYITDGLRRHLPVLLALSCNSPMWEGEVTGMMSSRTPIFRHFPRVGIPPHYGSWKKFARRVNVLMEAGAIPDYTYLWWDVRPHPNLGTVELRVFDQQTGLDQTVALAALSLCLVHRYSSNYQRRRPLIEVPGELIDDNKVRAALRGLDADLADLPGESRAPARELIVGLCHELAPEAAALGCEKELASVSEMAVRGTGANRQLAVLEKDGFDGAVRAAILEG